MKSKVRLAAEPVTLDTPCFKSDRTFQLPPGTFQLNSFYLCESREKSCSTPSYLNPEWPTAPSLLIQYGRQSLPNIAGLRWPWLSLVRRPDISGLKVTRRLWR